MPDTGVMNLRHTRVPEVSVRPIPPCGPLPPRFNTSVQRSRTLHSIDSSSPAVNELRAQAALVAQSLDAVDRDAQQLLNPHLGFNAFG